MPNLIKSNRTAEQRSNDESPKFHWCFKIWDKWIESSILCPVAVRPRMKKKNQPGLSARGMKSRKNQGEMLEIRHDSNDVSYVSYDEWSIAGPIWQKRLPDYLAFFCYTRFYNKYTFIIIVCHRFETTVVTVTKNYVPACLIIRRISHSWLSSGEDGNLTSISKDGLTEIRNWRCRSLQWLPSKLRWQLKY